jgi:cobalt/nickel transport system ATP-binding protein
MENYKKRVSHHLSLGEKKHIAIATVLSMQPEVLVYDEPTGRLDPRLRRSLTHLLMELPLTMLVLTHDMFLVREIFPHMIYLYEGQMVSDGRTQVFMEDVSLQEGHSLERP